MPVVLGGQYFTMKETQTAPQPTTAARQDGSAAIALPAPGASLLLQPKLLVGHPDDPLEHEADRAADRVVSLWQGGGFRHPSGDAPTPSGVPLIQRRAASPAAGAVQASPQISSQIETARGGGQALPATLQPSLEAAFGMDFSGVRLHTDARADVLNRELQARAFTTGRDIFFREGAYQPHTAEGVRLLGHELGHVGQQGGEGMILQRQIANGQEQETRLVADYIVGEMLRNIRSPEAREINRHINNPLTYLEGLNEFRRMVRYGGPWDHKNHIRITFGLQSYDSVSNRLFPFDLWSNIHYGYVGNKIGFSESTLLHGASAAQLMHDLPDFSGVWERFTNPDHEGEYPSLRRFDHPEDQLAIRIGYYLYVNHQEHVTVSDLLGRIRARANDLNARVRTTPSTDADGRQTGGQPRDFADDVVTSNLPMDQPGSQNLDARIEAVLNEFYQGFSSIPVTLHWEENGNRSSEPLRFRAPYYLNTGRTANSVRRIETAQQNRATPEFRRLRVTANVLTGKATPNQIRDVAQRALDEGLIHGRNGRRRPNDEDVTEWLRIHGVGIDCSGFVSQALNRVFSVILGDTSNPFHYSTSQFNTLRDMLLVSRPDQLRPGDTMNLSGHIRIISHVERNSSGVYFTTFESRAGTGSIGVDQNYWRYPNQDQFEGLEIRRSNGYAPAGPTDSASTYRRHRRLTGTPQGQTSREQRSPAERTQPTVSTSTPRQQTPHTPRQETPRIEPRSPLTSTQSSTARTQSTAGLLGSQYLDDSSLFNQLVNDILAAIARNEIGGASRAMQSRLGTSAGVPASYASATQMVPSHAVEVLKQHEEVALHFGLTRRDLRQAERVCGAVRRIWTHIVIEDRPLAQLNRADIGLSMLTDQHFRAMANFGTFRQMLLTRRRDGLSFNSEFEHTLLSDSVVSQIGLSASDIRTYFSIRNGIVRLNRFVEDMAAYMHLSLENYYTEQTLRTSNPVTLDSALSAAASHHGGWLLSELDFEYVIRDYISRNLTASEEDIVRAAARHNGRSGSYPDVIWINYQGIRGTSTRATAEHNPTIIEPEGVPHETTLPEIQITGDPNRYWRAAYRGNQRYAESPPAAGWPYRDDWRNLWQNGQYDDFARAVMDFQQNSMGISEERTDGILGPNTTHALLADTSGTPPETVPSIADVPSRPESPAVSVAENPPPAVENRAGTTGSTDHTHTDRQQESTLGRQVLPTSPVGRVIAQQLAQSGGITVAVYAASGVREASEFRRQAQRFAEDHGTIGIDRNGVLTVGCAMELNQGIGDILHSLQSQIDGLGLRTTPGQPYIKTLAIFTHGSETSLQAGFSSGGTTNSWVGERDHEAWVRAFAQYISPDHPRVLFYACSVSGTPSRGRTPFAQRIGQILDAQLEERYPDTGIDVETWGHLRPGHTTASSVIGGFTSDSPDRLDFKTTISRNLVTYILSHRETGGTGSTSAQPQATPNISTLTERRLNAQAERSFSRIFRSPTDRYTSVNSPYNTYIREIYNLGFDTVWRQVSSTDPVDFRSMGYSDDAASRLERGIELFRERFQREIIRIRTTVPLV
jgi:hypothetical protein